MKTLATAAALVAPLAAIAGDDAAGVQITRVGTQASVKGSADYFSGTVRIDSPFHGTTPARIGGASVSFEPGARTAWHSHPLGQTLIVTGYDRDEGKTYTYPLEVNVLKGLKNNHF
ncbi:MAG: hypothetical protein JSR69_17155 [Proteobacteria bacterium]|nr:hypothetical protein [Pseudomonadota bacterium]